MLDLEYLFTELPRDAVAAKHLAAGGAERTPRRTLKAALYGVLDRWSPPLPLNMTNWMPVFHGGGMEQFLWMANHSLLYEETGGECDFDIRYCLRDKTGGTVWRDRLPLNRDTEIRVDLSEHFPPSPEIEIGSIALDRYAMHPTVRGTTRPQTEVVSKQSAATLHFQAAGHDQDKSFRAAWHPNVERLLFTIVNASSAPFRVIFGYWPNTRVTGAPLARVEHTLPPFGTALHEVELPAGAAEDLNGEMLLIRWRTHGYGKLHIVSMARDGNRMSIDHV